MDFKTKLSEFIEWTIPIWWGFVVGIGFSVAFLGGENYLQHSFFNISLKYILFAVIGVLILVGFFIKHNFIKRTSFILTTFLFAIFWYYQSTDYSSYSDHLTSKIHNGEKYKFLDTRCILYGTIIADPDIRENFSYIVISPDKIITNLDKFEIEIDNTALSYAIVEKDFVENVNGVIITTKNNVKIRLAGIDTRGYDIYSINKFLVEKILKKEVTFFIEENLPQDKDGNIFAYVQYSGELVNNTILKQNLAKFYDDPNAKIIKKVVRATETNLSSKSGLVRARVSPQIGDYYTQMSYGDYVKIDTTLSLPKLNSNPAGFNFRKYLNARGIYAVTKNIRDKKDIQYIGVSDNASFLTRFSYAVRQRLLLTIRRTVPYPQSAFLGGVTLGYRGGVPRKIREEFQSTGVAHVLALSGLHTGFIAVLLLIFCRFLRIKSVFRFIVVSVGLLLFVIMTGASPATTRAALMYALGLFFYDVLKLTMSKSTRVTIIIAAIVILLKSPLLISDASFVLSFMAVWSLIYIGPVTEKFMIRIENRWIHQFFTFPLFVVILGMTIISLLGGIIKEMSLVKMIFPFVTRIDFLDTYFPKWFNIPNSSWFYKGEFMLVSLSLFLCGVIIYNLYYLSGKSLLQDMKRNSAVRGLLQFVSAQVAINLGMMWPLSSIYFYRFPIAGFYANFLAIPLIGINVQLGWIAALIDVFFSSIGLEKIGLNIALLIGAFNDQMSQMFLGIAKTWGNFIPYPYVDMFMGKHLIIWYGILVVLIYHEKIINLIKYLWTDNKQIFIILISVISFVSISFAGFYIFNRPVKMVRIIFFDVGFGNSVLLQTPTKNVLIDTGPPGPPGWAPAESAISPTFTKYKIKKLDDIIVTSLKPQCVGGLKYILDSFPTKNIYLPNKFVNISTTTYYNFLESMNMWYAMSNPYNYEYTGLYITNFEVYNKIKSYHGTYDIVSETKVLYDEKVEGKNFKLELIVPKPIKNTLDDIGNASYFVKITYAKTSILYLGQAGLELQNSLMTGNLDNLKSDIVVIPQNGNYNSFSEQFISKLSAKVAVLQYGWTNQRIGYFPVSLVVPTIKKYTELGMEVYRTDYMGAVILNFNGDDYKIRTVIPEQEYKTKDEFSIEN